jgi:hypothetical protein
MGTKIIRPNFSDMQQNIQRNIAASQQKVLQRDECWNAPSYFDGKFIGIQKPWNQYSISPNPDTTGDCGDMEFRLPTPYKIFFISNQATGAGVTNIWIHLTPIGAQYTAGGKFAPTNGFPTGLEQMFSLTGGLRVDRPTPFLRLKNPTDRVYLSADTGSGSQFSFTLCATNEEDFPINLGYLAP